MSIQKLETIMEPAKETAKKIRATLKVNFPNTKFSVRTDVYSGGSSVNVSWNDLPLVDEVETVVNKFKSGSFDGMTDMYETTGYIMDGKRYVGAKYIFTSRKLSDERKELIKNWMKENYAEVNENSYDYYYHFNKAEELMIKEENKPVETVEQTEVIENNKTTENIQVELNYNTEKNGIELKFNGIPSEGTRQLLKDNGFRWSKFSKVWWITKTDKADMFAQGFVSAYNEPIENESTEPETIANEVEQTLISDSELIGRKVFGQWGVMAGWNYGIITGETIYNEIIVKWEDWEEETGNDNYTLEIKDLVFVTDNTNLDAVGVYLMPIENNEPTNNNEFPEVEPVTEETTNETTYNQDGKIKVRSIQFLWSESGYIQDNQIVNTFSEAETLIHSAAIHAPDNGAYDKTKFTITWTDSRTYTGRIDIQYKHSATIKPLQTHIMQFTKSVINDDGYFHNDEERNNYKEFIDTYSLTDDKQEPTPNNHNSKGKVLDFNSKFKQRQEDRERQEALNYFTDNILPFLSYDDKMRLLEAQEDKEKFNTIMYELMLKSKSERLKQK